MEGSLEAQLYQAILSEDQEAISHLLSKGANPNKTVSQGKTCLGEAANIGNVDIIKLLVSATKSTSSCTKIASSNSSRKTHLKGHKRKLKHHNPHEETIMKCKNKNDRSIKDLHFGKYEMIRDMDDETSFDKNQGYFVVKHGEGSSSDESKICSKRSPLSPTSLTPSPQDDLEWDEDIVNVAATTTEDETWTSMYKWYAAILESTGAAIESASIVTNGIDQQDAFTRTALHYAAEKGHIEVVKVLIEAGCKVNVTAGDGSTALHVAVVKNYVDIVKLLISAGSHVNYKTHEKITALHFAASWGYLDMVKILVNNGAYTEARDTNERTALYFAAGRGHVEVVKYLIDVGANLNGEEIHGYTPLCEAVWQRYASVVDLLLTYGARIPHSHRLLHYAIIQRQEEIVKLLTRFGAGINLHNDNGDTPLLLSVRLSQPAIANILLAKGANANACNSITGANALHIAVESIDVPEEFEILLQYLLEYKIDMNTTALTGDTALNRALLLEKDHAAAILIRYGADVNTCDLNSCGLDNLSIANGRRSFSLTSMLLKAGHYPVPIQSGVTKLCSKESRLYHACRQPLNLAELCRIKIRHLGKRRTLFKFISSLPLPKSLKAFLMMENEGV